MSVTRTPDVELDTDFVVAVPVTKAYVDKGTGERHIVGVATGIAEDRDGERVSKNAIAGMGRDIQSGGVKVTSSHQQDWMTEFGDVCKYQYDAETDEMIVDGVLPPEGVDPIADKAWRTANTEKVGWSIGGKLLKSFYERNEVGKKRKVLDAIKLRHLCLTKNPSYPHSFAEAVAKAWTGDEPADDEFTLDSEIEKAATGSWASGSDASGANSGRDSVGSGQRNAGTKDPKSKGMSTEDDGSDDEDPDESDESQLPKAKDERHLACPNCGHEFAADLPVDPNERQNDDDPSTNDDKDEAGDTGKSAGDLMSDLTKTLDALRALAEADAVAKTTDAAASEPDVDVAKAATPDGPSDVEKMIAASHKANTDRIAEIEQGIGEGFALVAKSHKAIVEMIQGLPQGRKSTARVLPPPNGHDDNAGTVEKTTEQLIDEAPDALTALKIQNAKVYGVR